MRKSEIMIYMQNKKIKSQINMLPELIFHYIGGGGGGGGGLYWAN